MKEILNICEIRPAVLQTEVHPYYQAKELKKFLDEEQIVIQAWYPLGHGDKELLEEPLWKKLGEKYRKSPAQIILRWHIQSGNVVIPGSKNLEHIRDNFRLFDFKLTEKKWKRSLRWSGTKDTIPALRNYCSVMRRWFRLWILRNKPEETAWVLHCSIVL